MSECKFSHVLGVCITCIGIFVVATIGITVAFIGTEWREQCTAPFIEAGRYGGGGYNTDDVELYDGDMLNQSAIHCDDGYHKITNGTVYCECNTDGERCDTLVGLCANNTCTKPIVENGYIVDETNELRHLINGTAIDPGYIFCRGGYRRTAETNFPCICGDHGDPCENLTDACEPTGGPIEPNPSPTPSPDDDGAFNQSGADDGMPEWLLALIIVLNIVACVLLAVGCYFFYDSRNKKSAEKYWDLYMQHREQYDTRRSFGDLKEAAKPAPVAIEVGELSGKAATGGSSNSSPVITAAIDTSGSLLQSGLQDASRAEAMERAGRTNEAAKLFKSASKKLKESVSDKGADDRSYNIAVRASKYDLRAKELEGDGL